jgi:signal peptidase I
MIGVLLLVRSMGLESFAVPSGSMEPTLRIGDSILVSKSAYGLRLPFTKVNLTGPAVPERGDVVVFVVPGSESGDWTDEVDLLPVFPSEDYIKRVVALPGETVAVKSGRVVIDGKRLPRKELGPYRYLDADCEAHANTRYSEQAGALQTTVLEAKERHRRRRDWGPETVPAGHVFVLGDQRDRSKDSRSFGFVPLGSIKGKATRVWLSMDTCETAGALPELRRQRLGKRIE